MKSAKKLRASPDTGKVVRNYVHELLAQVEGRIKRDFAKIALAGALKFLDEIAEAEGLPVEKRIELLSAIYAAANRRIEKLAHARQSEIPLWQDRDDRYISPSAFVVLYYPTYKKGLTLADVGRVDKGLYRALQNMKARYGWPEGFELLTKTAALDALVQEQGPDIDLKGLADAPPAVRKARQRTYSARYRRQLQK